MSGATAAKGIAPLIGLYNAVHYNNEYFTQQRYTGFANYYYWQNRTPNKVILINRRVPHGTHGGVRGQVAK